LDRATVTRRTLVGDDDSPDRVLLRTNSSKSDADCHWTRNRTGLRGALPYRTTPGDPTWLPAANFRPLGLSHHLRQLVLVRHLAAGHVLHQFLHLVELLDQVVDLLDLGARTLGDPATARTLDDLRHRPL